MSNFVVIVIALLSLLCIGLLCRMGHVCRTALTDKSIVGLVMKNIDAYVLLITSDYHVVLTNYYTNKGELPSSKQLKVGNLLHCKNGVDAGVCGTHALCAECPIRIAVRKAFRDHENFSGLYVPLTLYDANTQSKTINRDAIVSGNYLSINGNPRVLLTLHDISEQKRTEHELIEARRHAEESDRMKTLFLANTSHEIRTPLNAIVGFSDLLTTELSPAERQEYAQVIRANSDILLQLVNDILDLSKIETETLEFEFSTEDLNTLLEELECVYRSRQPNNRVRIVFDRKYPSCLVRVDRNRFSQVVSNFLSNAVKFTSEGEIIFGYEIREADYYVYVKDTGIGIAEEKFNQIFQRFVKIGSHKQGLGIGLAICRSIVQSTGGEIGFTSKQGKGSTFWFSVPKNFME